MTSLSLEAGERAESSREIRNLSPSLAAHSKELKFTITITSWMSSCCCVSAEALGRTEKGPHLKSQGGRKGLGVRPRFYPSSPALGRLPSPFTPLNEV